MPFRRFCVQIVFGRKSRHPIEGTVFTEFRKVLYRTLVKKYTLADFLSVAYSSVLLNLHPAATEGAQTEMHNRETSKLGRIFLYRLHCVLYRFGWSGDQLTLSYGPAVPFQRRLHIPFVQSCLRRIDNA